MIDVLLAHRRLPAASITSALHTANTAGIIDPTVITVEARRHTDGRPPTEVVPIGVLGRYDRPSPSLEVYDQLLTRDLR